MIQVLLMDGKKFVNEYKDFKDNEKLSAIRYIREALLDDKHSIIEISKWQEGVKRTKMERQ